MKIKLLTHTGEPEKTIAHAAKVCYSSKPILDIETTDIEQYLGKLKSLGHWSPFEHASFTFAIEGISRACSHQLVRHRMASYSQRSQRYIKESGFDSVVPDSINADADIWLEYVAKVLDIEQFYQRMVDKGIPKEDARYILPNATATQLTMTMNARAWMHFANLRLCNRAQWEIRRLATEIVVELTNKFPLIFKSQLLPTCLKGKCTEGEYTCKIPIARELIELV